MKKAPLGTLALVLASLGLAQARPYLMLLGEAPAMAEAANPGEPMMGAQMMQAGADPLQTRVVDHLGRLVTHGSSAVKSAVAQVRPDLSLLGQDLGDAYSVTRENVGKRIEPIAQEAKPYLDKAHSAVAPYVAQAKEEVPKLLEQAKPAIMQVGQQVRGGLSVAWDKLKQGASTVSDKAQQVASAAAEAAAASSSGVPEGESIAMTYPSGDQLNQVGQQVQQAAGSAIQQAGQAIGAPAQPMPAKAS